jgi:UDP-glucose 4-epimerase
MAEPISETAAGPPEALDVLVTGGSGFIGSHVVDRLLATGHRPRIFDLHRSPHHPPSTVPLVRGDLGDLRRLRKAMRGCDAVIHLAAAADVGLVEAAPVAAEEHNSRGTLHVLEAARREEVGRVVYASTIWVYSDTEGDLMEESVALAPPAHLYTATKLAGELYCRAYQELYGIEHTILRFGIPYGPRARPAGVLPRFVSRALAGEALTVAGDGLQSRRYVYVEDLADGVARGLAPVAANRVYNLAGGEDTSVIELAGTVRELVGDIDIVHGPGRNGDFSGAPVSAERAEQELGWTPSTSLREGVRRYVAWHREANPEPPPPQRAKRWLAGAPLLRRGMLALAWAAVVAVMVLGLASLMPVVTPSDSYDTFVASLLILLPMVLAAGFEWDGRRRRALRIGCWTAFAAAVAPWILPWPGVIDRLADAHPVFLALLALSAAIAASSAGSAPPLRSWLAAAQE